jgi:hypothetical protein
MGSDTRDLFLDITPWMVKTENSFDVHYPQIHFLRSNQTLIVCVRIT